MKRPFIIDCDTGTDDAIAICAAMGCEEVEIVGITSVNGNVAEKYTSTNNLNLVEYLGKDIPVCHGAVFPIAETSIHSASSTHGATGLGNVILPQATKKEFEKQISSRFIYESALQYQGELELLVVGPMTNIALAIVQYPELVSLIKHIYFMGGAVWGGNCSTTAEFNIWEDPEAAHVVFTSGIPLTMVGLDVTLKATMQREDVIALRANNTKASNFCADILDFMFDRCEKGGEDTVMHDALAFAAAIIPDCMKYQDYFMDVECRGDFTRGHTYADIYNRSGKKPNVRAALEVDVPTFRKWLVEQINKA